MQCTLHKLFGTWPIDEFKALDEETQKKFWQEAGGNREGLKKTVENLLIRRVVETQFASEAGPFLPLSVWATQGYNTADIEARAPMELHPVLGPTYQVSIKSSGREKTDSLIREQMVRLLQKGKKSAASSSGGPVSLPGEGSLDHGEDEEQGTEGSDEASTVSSSVSSSDSSVKKKKKRKSKKSKKSNKNKKQSKTDKREKDKKDQDKQQDAKKQRLLLEKADRSRALKIRTDCTKALAKIAPVQLFLEELLKHPKLSHAPSFAVKKAKGMLKKLNDLDCEARDQLKSKENREVSFTLPGLIVITKEAMETKCLLEGMLDAVSKHAANEA